MCTFLDRTLAVILSLSAPEDSLTPVIRSLQLKPGVIGVDRPPWEEVSDLLCSDDDIHAHRIAPTHHRLNTIERPRNGRNLSPHTRRNLHLCFLSDRECGCQFRL